MRNWDIEIGRRKDLLPHSWPMMTCPSSFAPWDTPFWALDNFLLFILSWSGLSSIELLLDIILGPTLNQICCLLLFMQVPNGRAWTLLKGVSGSACYLLFCMQIVLGTGLRYCQEKCVERTMFPISGHISAWSAMSKVLGQNVPAVDLKVTYRNQQSKSMLKIHFRNVLNLAYLA